jgi:hypothetical protein
VSVSYLLSDRAEFAFVFQLLIKRSYATGQLY